MRADRFEMQLMPEPNTGCWLWTGNTFASGYGRILSGGKHLKASRVAYRLYKGAIPAGMCVCHRCDTPACCNPDHLFLGTVQENFADMRRKGRNPKGERQGCSKLTEAQVLSILSDPRDSVVIAAELGVSAVLVSRIKRRDAWKHVPGLRNEVRRKLTDVHVAEIRSLKGNGQRQVDIGRRYGVSQRYVSLIMRHEARKA